MARRILISSILAASLAAPLPALAHCDTQDGPVLTAARKALDTGNVNLALVWVQPNEESRVRDAFERARQNRQSEGPDGKSTQAYFETLVRVHREGEGATFEGVKPAGIDIGPAVPAAERALESNDTQGLDALLHERMKQGIGAQHRNVIEKRNYDPNDVAKGRAYVGAYVNYMHYVEGIYQATTNMSPHAHDHGNGASDTGHGEHGKGASVSADGEHRHGPAVTADRHAAHEAHAAHDAHAAHVPWMLAGLFGVAMVGQTGWIIRRRKRQAP